LFWKINFLIQFYFFTLLNNLYTKYFHYLFNHFFFFNQILINIIIDLFNIKINLKRFIKNYVEFDFSNFFNFFKKYLSNNYFIYFILVQNYYLIYFLYNLVIIHFIEFYTLFIMIKYKYFSKNDLKKKY